LQETVLREPVVQVQTLLLIAREVQTQVATRVVPVVEQLVFPEQLLLQTGKVVALAVAPHILVV
jgi:hypothetical protein